LAQENIHHEDDDRSDQHHVHFEQKKSEGHTHQLQTLQPVEISSEPPQEVNKKYEEDKNQEGMTNFQEFLNKKKEKLEQERQLAEKSSEMSRGYDFKYGSSHRYKGKRDLKSRSPAYERARPTHSPMKKNFGYGELPKPESPQFRESCFDNPRKNHFEGSEPQQHFEENPSTHLQKNEAIFDSPQIEISKSPIKNASDIYSMLKENSEQRRYENISSQHRQDYRQPSYFQDAPANEPIQYAEQPTSPVQQSAEQKYDPYYQEENSQSDMMAIPQSTPYTKLGVEIFKSIVFAKVSKAMQDFGDTFFSDMKTESLNFKVNVVFDEISMRLDKYKFRSQLFEDIINIFDEKDIRLNSLNIGCGEQLYQPKLKCLFSDNPSAIESFIKGYKAPDLFPTFSQLQMIIDFHTANRYKLSICENSVKNFVLTTKRPMIEKQYFSQWISEIYGLNMSSITTSSITQPRYMEDL